MMCSSGVECDWRHLERTRSRMSQEAIVYTINVFVVRHGRIDINQGTTKGAAIQDGDVHIQTSERGRNELPRCEDRNDGQGRERIGRFKRVRNEPGCFQNGPPRVGEGTSQNGKDIRGVLRRGFSRVHPRRLRIGPILSVCLCLTHPPVFLSRDRPVNFLLS